ncbi:MAG: anti-sigma regulatory factor [Anaerolineae bacterium]|nr:anti-sigma regulatory factor [Anaerolineae bacterium]MCA9892366.1 anti-sigma regulatory factor [Anaerolineae bacterium]
MPSAANFEQTTAIEHVNDVSVARRIGMNIALDMGFDRADATRIAVAISELARNIVVYANSGLIKIIGDHSANPPFIQVIASDSGPGIEDVELAMTDHWTSSRGLGLGLSGSRRLMDDFNIETEVGRGTTITITKWLR